MTELGIPEDENIQLSWDDILQLAAETKKKPFKPYWYYSTIGDMIEIFWEDTSYFADTSTWKEGFDIYRAFEDKRPVGIRIMGAMKQIKEKAI